MQLCIDTWGIILQLCFLNNEHFIHSSLHLMKHQCTSENVMDEVLMEERTLRSAATKGLGSF